MILVILFDGILRRIVRMSMVFSPLEDALSLIRSGTRVFIHGGSATPQLLIRELCRQGQRLQNVEIIHLHTLGAAAYGDPSFRNHFRVANLFLGENLRKAFDRDRVDYLPCFLSEIPSLFRSGRRPLDVALLHVSPPDKHGFCSLGVSVDVAKAASEAAKIRIGQVNKYMPRVHGDGFIHVSQFDALVECHEELPEFLGAPISDADRKIGEYVASLVENGSTLQVGIGSVPDATLAALKDHRNLGVHSEMYSDGIVNLIEAGAVDNSKKKVHPGKTVSGFVMGTKKVYRFIDDNPAAVQLDIGYVNDTRVIARNPKVVAINSALEVDLTGQVCADSIGSRIISGVGGQMDFIRGAALSEGGKPIIALPSRTQSGISRIVATLKPGAGVVTTRAHVHYIVTEFGIADLFGKTLSERAQALIRIAHPDCRERLQEEWCAL